MNSFREAPELLARITGDGMEAIAFNHPFQV